jgi:hypothetical protein
MNISGIGIALAFGIASALTIDFNGDPESDTNTD